MCECAYGYVYMGDSCIVCVPACGCMCVYVCGLIHSVCGDSATMYECVYGCIYGGTQAQCMCVVCVCVFMGACICMRDSCTVCVFMGACVCGGDSGTVCESVYGCMHVRGLRHSV